MDVWFWVWAALAAVLIVGEIFTAGFFLLPFGLGAAAAAVLALIGAPLGWQWGVFLALSAVLLLSLRRFADRITHEPPEKVGADRLIGKEGVVVETIESDDGTGRVRIESEEWRAGSAESQTLAAGTHVVVERVSGTHLVVRPAHDTVETKE